MGSTLDLDRIIRGEPLPAVVVDLDAFDRNVAHAARFVEQAGGMHTLRIATKSIRVPFLIERVLAHGAPFQGLMCYSAQEAAWLSSLGIDDLLVAYPTVQDADLQALRTLHEDGRPVRLMVDSLAGVQAVSLFMEGVERPFEVTVDVDMSLRTAGAHMGVRRSPVRSVADVVQLFEATRDLPDVRLASLMGYEAQVAGLGDRNPFKKMLNPAVKVVRSRSIRSAATRRKAIRDELHRRGFDVDLFNGGGTGSLDSTTAEPWLTEVTMGSGLLCSHLFDYYSNVRFEPACFFALQVVRSSDHGFVTCQGGGYIASGEPGWDKVPVPHHPPGLSLVGAEGCGEVQTPLKLEAGTSLQLGDAVFFRHAKAGELAERFGEYLLVSSGEIVERVKTYRGLGQCFL